MVAGAGGMTGGVAGVANRCEGMKKASGHMHGARTPKANAVILAALPSSWWTLRVHRIPRNAYYRSVGV
ncbi:hypothetical protein GCM10010343_19590 [Streptomyces avidinii]|nr:hypothetical protein GCM10010343_19590 [Streptomyces avidinii]